MKHHILLATCAVSALTLAATGAFAQAAPAPGQQAQSATTLGEIVVTAERREANLQTVPEAVTAFTSKDRNIKGISTVQDMTNFTPGFTYSSQLDRPVMRGLSRDTNQYTADSAVAVYYDDFFSNSTFLVGRDDMLIDQVEILLGSQGTLYGRNAIGGLINTLSKRPTDELQGEMRVIAGNYGYTKVEGTVSGPIFPGLDFRLSAYDDNQNRGYLNNVVPGMPSEGGVRHDPYVDFQLEWKNDKNDVWLDAYSVGFNNDRGGPGSLLGVPTAGDYGTALTTYGEAFFNPNFPYGGGAVPGSVVGQIGDNNPTLNDIRDFAHSATTDITLDRTYAVVLHFTHHFDGFDMKYIGGYSQYHYELHTAYFNNDNSPITSYQIPTTPGGFGGPLGVTGCYLGAYLTGTLDEGPYSPACSPLTVNPTQIFSFTTSTNWFSHELLFQSTGNGPFQWVAGVYYFNEWDNNPETVQEPGQPQIGSPVNVLDPALGTAPNPGLNNILLDYQDRIQSLAEYAQVDYKITPTIKLTAGIRYTQDWKHAQEETRIIYFGSDVYGGTANEGIYTPQNFGELLPAFDITTQETDNPENVSAGEVNGPGICSVATVLTSGPFAGAMDRCLSDKSSAVTGTAGIEWTPDPDTLVYARYNRGYKAFALNAGYNGYTPEAKPEYLNDFEVGFKKTFNRNLIIDADVFYYDYSNYQVPIGVSLGAISVTEFVSVPKAVSDGFELQAIWNPIEHLNLSLTYGLDHTSISSSCDSVGGVATGTCFEDAVDPYATEPGAQPVGNRVGTTPYAPGTFLQSVKGNELPNAPENKVAFNANYTIPFEAGNLILSGTFIWKDKMYGSIFERSYYEAPSWNETDLRATWSGDHDRYEVVLYVKNLFNQIGYDAGSGGYASGSGAGDPAGLVTANPGYDLTPPRLYGVEFHYKF